MWRFAIVRTCPATSCSSGMGLKASLKWLRTLGAQERRATELWFTSSTRPATLDAFVNSRDESGCAVFATAGRATAEGSLSTLRELVDRTFFYKSPANRTHLQIWLQGRFCGIGVTTFLATQVEKSKHDNLKDVHDTLDRTLNDAVGLRNPTSQARFHAKIFYTESPWDNLFTIGQRWKT